MRRAINATALSLLTSFALTGTAFGGCPGDCSSPPNGEVDFADLLSLIGQWGTPGACELTGDNTIDFADVLALIALWGPCPVATTGACCTPSTGACMDVLENDCDAAGGLFAGAGTDCTDTDGDRIPNVFELGDCSIPAGACFAGTSAFSADTDADGLPDGDEVYGTLGGLDLPALGVDPCRKDILLETDWVYSSGQSPDRNKLHINQVNRLVTAFANGGTFNPDGTQGITLHIDYGQAPYSGGNAIQDSGPSARVDVDSFGFNSGEYFDMKDANFATNRHGYFRYSLLCDSYSVNGSYINSSGLGELPGDDTIVSMGQWALGDDNFIGNTVMHELGHNLDLRHGGFENRNFKPNYNSVMNYWNQFCGADFDGDAIPDDITDYSHGVNIFLDEDNLFEPDGVTGFGPGIDWNTDGDTTDTLGRNINCRLTNTFANSTCVNHQMQDNSCGTQGNCNDSSCNTLGDHDDWIELELNHLNDPDDGPREVIHCVRNGAIVADRSTTKQAD